MLIFSGCYLTLHIPSELYEEDKVKHIKCYKRLSLLKCTNEAAQTPLTYIVS